MYLARLPNGFIDIVWGGATTEVDSDRELTGGDIDDGRRGRKKGSIFGEVRHTERCRHDDQS